MPVTQKIPGMSGWSATQSALVWHVPQPPTALPPHRVSPSFDWKQTQLPLQLDGAWVHELRPSAQFPWPVTHTFWTQISPPPQSAVTQHSALIGIHVPWQSCVPAGHWHAPFWHTLPPLHEPQNPPQPSSPQTLPPQIAVQDAVCPPRLFLCFLPLPLRFFASV